MTDALDKTKTTYVSPFYASSTISANPLMHLTTLAPDNFPEHIIAPILATPPGVAPAAHVRPDIMATFFDHISLLFPVSRSVSEKKQVAELDAEKDVEVGPIYRDIDTNVSVSSHESLVEEEQKWDKDVHTIRALRAAAESHSTRCRRDVETQEKLVAVLRAMEWVLVGDEGM